METVDRVFVIYNKENREFRTLSKDQNLFNEEKDYNRIFDNPDIKEIESLSLEMGDIRAIYNEFKGTPDKITLLIYNSDSISKQTTEQEYHDLLAESLEETVKELQKELDFTNKKYEEYNKGEHFYHDFPKDIKTTTEKIREINHFAKMFKLGKIEFNIKVLKQ